MSQPCFDYIDQNQGRFLDELRQFLTFPSISADSRHKEDVSHCAQWLVEHLKQIGLESRLIPTQGHPIVWARCKGQSDKKLIIYGHYDVQPVDPVDPWQTDPFMPSIRDGFMYARGASDDKGQLFAHIKGIESLLKTRGGLPCEVVFLFEGEEECGGKSLEHYIKNEKVNLAADAVIVSDTSLYDEATPAITYGLRGMAALDIKVTTAAHALHSGSYGGAVGNAVKALSYIISRCSGPDGVVQIPGFYDGVRLLADWERDNIRRLNYDDDKLMAEVGSKIPFGEAGFSTLERMWARPTFEVNGMSGGYAGEGFKTIIPSCATAKISMRLVPDQNPHTVVELAKKYLKSICPPYADIDVVPLSAAEPVIFDVENPMIQAGRQALQYGFNAEPVYIRCGGSIPVVTAFWKELKKPVVLMGFGLDSDGAHSVNERFKIDNFIRGAKSSAYLLSNR